MTGSETRIVIDAAFLSVWRQALLEQKKIMAVGGATFPYAEQLNNAWHKLILNWKAWNSAPWNEILKPNRDGQKWRAKAQRSCNFCKQADTSAWSPMQS
jgi:hypothetical protein